MILLGDLLEAILALLLIATLVYAVRLDRTLKRLRRDRKELATHLQGLQESTRMAEDGTERLRIAAEIAGKQITRQLQQATVLKDDLSFLCERAERSAQSLERRVVGVISRETSRADGEARLDQDLSPGRSKAERDLMRALRLER